MDFREIHGISRKQPALYPLEGSFSPLLIGLSAQDLAETPQIDADQCAPGDDREPGPEGVQLHLRGARQLLGTFPAAEWIGRGEEGEQTQGGGQHFEDDGGVGKIPALLVRLELP